MCKNCWQERGAPRYDSEKIRHAADLVNRLYTVEGEIVGGMLHAQVDDWNIEDIHWDDPFGDYLIKMKGRQPLPTERAIVRIFASLSIDERASALALAHGYWEPEA